MLYFMLATVNISRNHVQSINAMYPQIILAQYLKCMLTVKYHVEHYFDLSLGKADMNRRGGNG